jgi:hypothetical protein
MFNRAVQLIVLFKRNVFQRLFSSGYLKRRAKSRKIKIIKKIIYGHEQNTNQNVYESLTKSNFEKIKLKKKLKQELFLLFYFSVALCICTTWMCVIIKLDQRLARRELRKKIKNINRSMEDHFTFPSPSSPHCNPHTRTQLLLTVSQLKKKLYFFFV